MMRSLIFSSFCHEIRWDFTSDCEGSVALTGACYGITSQWNASISNSNTIFEKVQHTLKYI